jgi:hypothetical protein
VTEIEQALFYGDEPHCVSAFELTLDTLAIHVHPAVRPERLARARFRDLFTLTHDPNRGDESGMTLPWAIIGFEAERPFGERWRFCLHTDSGEFEFWSSWPEIEKAV